jgi:ankyrin repeat protein
MNLSFLMKNKIIFLFFLLVIDLSSQESNEHEEINLKLDEKSIYSELFKSCERGDLKKVIYLVEEYNPNLNQKNKKGTPPLIIASLSGSKEIVQYLISKEIDINITDKNGNTSLLSSLLRGNLEIAKILLEKKPKLIIKNKKGVSPLLICSANGYVEILEVILSQQVDINQQDEDGNTALHFSILGGHEDIVERLLEKDANIKIQNKKGRSAVALASESGIFELLEVFKKNPKTKQRLQYVEIGSVTTETNKDGLLSIKPKDLTNKEIKQNQLLYFLDDTDSEIGYGKIYLINPKFIRIKLDSGHIPIGSKAGYFE